VSPPARTARTPPVVFDDAAWAGDMRRATVAGRRVAVAARARYESDGVAIRQLRGLRSGRTGRYPAGTMREGVRPHRTGRTEWSSRSAAAGTARSGSPISHSDYGIRNETHDSRRYTRLHTDGCTHRPKPEVAALRLEQLAELGDHPRASHRAAASVCKFSDVDGARHVGVPVAKKDRVRRCFHRPGELDWRRCGGSYASTEGRRGERLRAVHAHRPGAESGTSEPQSTYPIGVPSASAR
jgi:hypothetical protein